MYNKMWRNIMTMSFMMKYLLANCQRTGSCSRTSKWDFMERKDGFIVYFHRVSFLTNKMLFLLLWLLFTVFWYLWAFNKWFCTDYAKKCENKWYWQIIFAAGGLHRVHQISKKHALDVITMRTVTIFFFTIPAIWNEPAKQFMRKAAEEV